MGGGLGVSGGIDVSQGTLSCGGRSTPSAMRWRIVGACTTCGAALFVAWAFKAVILRYGGLNAYRRAIPCFLGLASGRLSVEQYLGNFKYS